MHMGKFAVERRLRGGLTVIEWGCLGCLLLLNQLGDYSVPACARPHNRPQGKR